jgi:hypothetical protein
VSRWPHLITLPDLDQLLELAVEDSAALVELDARDLVVVLASADGEAENESALGKRVERRRLLGEQGGVAAQRRQ